MIGVPIILYEGYVHLVIYSTECACLDVLIDWRLRVVLKKMPCQQGSILRRTEKVPHPASTESQSPDASFFHSVHFSSRWYQCTQESPYIYMRSTPSLRSFSNVAFETVPTLVRLTMTLSRKIIERILFLCLSPPDNRWCDVIGFVPTGSVSNSSTLQISRDASFLWWLLKKMFCPPVYLLCHFF